MRIEWNCLRSDVLSAQHPAPAQSMGQFLSCWGNKDLVCKFQKMRTRIPYLIRTHSQPLLWVSMKTYMYVSWWTNLMHGIEMICFCICHPDWLDLYLHIVDIQCVLKEKKKTFIGSVGAPSEDQENHVAASCHCRVPYKLTPILLPS